MNIQRYLSLFLLLTFFSSPFSIFADEPHLHRELLITGCARSGTKYIAQVLRGCGLDVGHENVGKDGVASWVMVLTADSCPWGPTRKNLSFTHIFHQVRHPLDVISSIYTTEGPKSWGYITSHLPEISWNDPCIVRAAKYWYYWNLRAEAISEFTYRIEEIESVWPEFEKRLGRRLDPSVLTTTPKNVNHRDLKPKRHNFDTNIDRAAFTWEDLQRELDPVLYRNIRHLAQKYGYVLEP